MKHAAAFLLAMMSPGLALGASLHVDIGDIPDGARAACMFEAPREQCPPERQGDAQWALAHDGRAIALACQVRVERWDELVQRIGCGVATEGNHVGVQIDFDLNSLRTLELDRIVRRCSPEPLSGAEPFQSVQAAALQAATEARCAANLEATIHLQRNARGRNFVFVLRNVQLNWRYE